MKNYSFNISLRKDVVSPSFPGNPGGTEGSERGGMGAVEAEVRLGLSSHIKQDASFSDKSPQCTTPVDLNLACHHCFSL